jgi:hypothetical protein
VALDDEDEEVGEDLAEDEVSEGRTRVVAAAPPTWGPLPAIVMIPCVAVMFLVTLMGLELVRGMWGYHQPTKVSGTLTRAMASMFDSDLPKE